MSKIWKHPKLGTFEHDGDIGWIQECNLPAFKIFTWEMEDEEDPGIYEVSFSTEDETQPSAGAAALLLKVMANQKKLADLVPKALWEDFNGRGPKTGMWWSGDMKQVSENFGYDERPAPKGPNDLLSAMRFSGITIREKTHYYEGPIAELSFSAVFEEEHGIGVLTDGEKLIGLGYMCDVTPFETAEGESE